MPGGGGSDSPDWMSGLPAAAQASDDPAVAGLYQMAMNPATGGQYDPYGLLWSTSNY